MDLHPTFRIYEKMHLSVGNPNLKSDLRSDDLLTIGIENGAERRLFLKLKFCQVSKNSNISVLDGPISILFEDLESPHNSL